MTSETIWEITGWSVFAFWILSLGPAVLSLALKKLNDRSQLYPEMQNWSKVSVVLAAKDEAENIGAALSSLLEIDYPNLQVIAVNDRSEDETGSIMHDLARQFPQLDVVDITTLPENWLGKTHAMHLGAKRADGDLLLFTDGDVIHGATALKRAVYYLEQHKFDHLCLIPKMIPGGIIENALVAFFGFLFSLGTQPWLIPASIRRLYVGVGAFNLVRRKSYETTGGYQTLAMDVIDDVKLGKLMKYSGFRQDVLVAGPLVQVKWQSSAWGVICGLEKNAFASVGFSLLKLIAVTLSIGCLIFGPYLAVVFLPFETALGFICALFWMHFIYGIISCLFGGGFAVCPLFPFAALGILFAFWRSAIKTIRQGGIYWRDTFYPLDQLKKNLY